MDIGIAYRVQSLLDDARHTALIEHSAEVGMFGAGKARQQAADAAGELHGKLSAALDGVRALDGGPGAPALEQALEGLNHRFESLGTFSAAARRAAAHTNAANRDLVEAVARDSGATSSSDMLRQMAHREPATWTSDERWRAVIALRGPEGELGATRQILRTEPAAHLLSLPDEPTPARLEKLAAYAARWQGELVTGPHQHPLRTWLTELVALEPASVTQHEWIELAERLAADPHNAAALTRSIPRFRSLAGVMSVLGKGSGPGENTAVYVARWRLELDPSARTPEAMQSFVRNFVANDARLVSRERWAELVAYLDHDASNAMGITRELPGARPLREILADIAKGELSPGVHTERFLQHWRLELNPTASEPETMRTWIRDVVGSPRPPSGRGWAGIEARFAMDPENRMGLTRNILDQPDAAELFEILPMNGARGRAAKGPYLERWSDELGIAREPEAPKRRWVHWP